MTGWVGVGVLGLELGFGASAKDGQADARLLIALVAAVLSRPDSGLGLGSKLVQNYIKARGEGQGQASPSSRGRWI